MIPTNLYHPPVPISPVTLSAPTTPYFSTPSIPVLPANTYTKQIPFTPHISPLGNDCSEIPSGSGGSAVPADSSSLYNKFYLNYDQNLIGDIGALTNGELIKFVKSDMTSSAEAKPTFIYNQFKYPVTSSDGGNPKVTIYNNLSYTQPTNLIPWYDSYEDYFKNIKHLSQNASVIPEFIVSNFDNIANDNLTVKESCEPDYYGNAAYETLYGRDYFLQIGAGQDLEDFDKLPINKFIDKKSNRFKMVLTGIKKLLPYNGFYPSEYSKNIVGAFSDSFLFNNTSLEKQTLLQPLFGPGVFFNTIKAGVVCAYPFVQTGSTSDITSSDDLYISGTLKASGNRKATFEMLLKPEDLINDSGSIVYLDPARYTPYFGSSFIIPSASTAIQEDLTSLKKYKKILNNFLSETTSLFLQDSQLTRFVSNRQSKFGVAQAGKKYGMEIKISTGDYFSTLTRTENFPPSESIASVYGPKTRVIDYLFHAPPYLQATSSESQRYRTGDTLVVYVSVDTAVKPTAQQIVQGLYVATGSSNGVIGNGVPIKDFIANSSSLYNSMIDALDIFNLVAPDETSEDYSLEIKTKFEVPLINYIDKSIQVPQSSSYKVQTSSSSGLGTGSIEIVDYSIDGIWNRYGSLPENGQSIQLEISDKLFKDSSLIELLGFTRESKSLGVIANYKTVSEAVLIIPYQLDIPSGGRAYISTTKPTPQPIEKNKKFIHISRDKVSKAMGVDNYVGMKIYEIKNKLDTYTGPMTTLIKTLKTLVNYNVPPHLNWLYDRTIEPFAIYSAIFEHQLDRQELANIWQGTMPQIAETPESQEVVIEHELNSDEMLDDTIFRDGVPTYFKILKVKQRGHYEYENIQNNTTEQLNNKQWYSYNWPYDYFSLVELLNIKAGEVYSNQPMPAPEYADPGLNLQSQLINSQMEIVKQIINSRNNPIV